jgi:DNA-binding NarL/FixJ family response regulator
MVAYFSGNAHGLVGSCEYVRVVATDDLDSAVRAYSAAQEGVQAAQEQARRLVSDARAEVDRARERLAAAVVRAARRGVRQKEIAERTHYTRETVRRILRAGGVEAD